MDDKKIVPMPFRKGRGQRTEGDNWGERVDGMFPWHEGGSTEPATDTGVRPGGPRNDREPEVNLWAIWFDTFIDRLPIAIVVTALLTAGTSIVIGLTLALKNLVAVLLPVFVRFYNP